MSVNMSYEQIQNAKLDLVEKGKAVETYLLRKYEDRSVMSCYILFTPAGIVITGDLRVENHGVIAPGYGKDWFAQDLEPRYLAEKFLRKDWIPQAAIEFWRDRLEEYKETFEEEKAAFEKEKQECQFTDDLEFIPENFFLRKHDWRVGYTRHELRDATIIQALGLMLEEEENFESAHACYQAIPTWKDETTGFWVPAFDGAELGGFDYDPAALDWLSAIQRRFSECCREMPNG